MGADEFLFSFNHVLQKNDDLGLHGMITTK